MNCPRCNSDAHWKDGLIRGRQRFRCKDCNYRYSVEFKQDVNSAETRLLALEMYREGLDFRSIGRVLKVSYGTVFQWIKKWSEEMDLSKRKGETEVVELSELRAYVCRIKTTDRHGLLLIDMEEGLSLMSVGTGKQSQG